MTPIALYKHPLGLLTDLYQLTMAYGYWKLDLADREAVFQVSFRKHPFDGGFTVAAGLGTCIDFLTRFAFSSDDANYLSTLDGDDGQRLFDPAFITYLLDLRLACTIDAIPEGTVTFPQEPLIRVTGPILQCQLLETILLNMLNFSSLAATKAARICLAARGEPVLEYGLRRAQGIDGAMTASRSAYIGGCVATSNVLAGKLFGIPVKGTHAHSWVMCFDSEREAFDAYADAMPNNCILLVDTYNTLNGVRNAITVAQTLKARGKRLLGIRLDSGDLAYLSIESRKLLDEAGFADIPILASNDLDEDVITSLKDQHAAIAIWAVGTRLVTAYDQPALGGVYKLTALRDAGGQWQHKIKLSEQNAKITVPGILQVRRYHADSTLLGDLIFDQLLTPAGPTGEATIVDPLDITRQKIIPAGTAHEDILVRIFDHGKLVYSPPALPQIQAHARAQLASLHPGIKRSIHPHAYPVGLEPSLNGLRNRLIVEARGLA